MKTSKNIVIALIALALAAGSFNACKKDPANDTPPVLTVTVVKDADPAGGTAVIQYSFTSGSGINKIHIEAASNAKPLEIVTDSSFVNPLSSFGKTVNYHIPDMAKTDEKIEITVSITDAQGRMASKTVIVKSSSSKPIVTVTPTSSSLASGDSVVYSVQVTSVEPNLKSIKITSSTNGDADKDVAGLPFNNSASENFTFSYKLGAGFKTGDKIRVLFTALNDKSIPGVATTNITIK